MDGVLHEFSTIDGVVEDVAAIILNIKKIALKSFTEDENKVLEIDINGHAVVTAGDIKHDSDIQVLNPDLYICTVAEGYHFHVRMNC